MKKRILSIVLSVCIVFGLLNGIVFSTNALSDGDFRYYLDTNDTYAIISDYSGDDADITIPSFVDGYPVKEIGGWAFYWNSDIESVIIPDGVTDIGYAAFANSGLTNVTIPNSVLNIGEAAFSDCANLTNITIPSSVISIGDIAFSWCDSLTAINVDPGNTAYSSENGVLFDKNKTFLISYPKGKTETSYIIPNTVKTIGKEAFYYCFDLEEITIPNGVENIGEGAFQACFDLAEITIPNTVVSIGDFAFASCGSLESIIIPSSVTEIGIEVFDNCWNMTTIDVDPGNSAFLSEDNVLFDKNKTVLILYLQTKEETSYTVPGTVTRIAYGAFGNSVNLTEVILPDSVINIEQEAFYYCRNLSNLVLPNNLETIDDYAFSSCESLTQVTIPDSVTYISYNAFSYCENIEFYCKAGSLAHRYAIWYGINYTLLGNLTIDSDNDIIVSWPDGSFDDEVSLNASRITEGADFTLAESALADIPGNFALFDISLMKNNVSVQPDGVVKVLISIPDYYAPDLCSLYNIGSNGEATEIPITVENDFIVFETDRFSLYAVVEGESAPIFEKGDVNGDNDINIFDIMAIRDHIFGKSILEDNARSAADVNNDNDVNIFDIMGIRDHIFGKALLNDHGQ